MGRLITSPVWHWTGAFLSKIEHSDIVGIFALLTEWEANMASISVIELGN